MFCSISLGARSKDTGLSYSALAVATGVFESSLRMRAVWEADPEIVRSRLPGQGL